MLFRKKEKENTNIRKKNLPITHKCGIIDKNDKTKIGVGNMRFIDFREKPFELYGINEKFERLPLEVAQATSEGVTNLYNQASGGRVRFSTNSRKMQIKMVISDAEGVGFDLFRCENDTEIFAAAMGIALNLTKEEQEVLSEERQISEDDDMHAYTLYFPYCGKLKHVEIGIDDDARLEAGVPYRNEKPVVFYGSSITMGVGADRTGSNYVSMIAQRYNMNFINLGFAGNARGEQVLAEYMASLDMSVFVCDYDHNAYGPTLLRDTHLPLYKTIRAKHPDIPYIIISRPDGRYNSWEYNKKRRNLIFETYQYAKAHGDNNVVFIDGMSLFEGPYYHNCTRDGIHPNELGFYRMASKIGPVVARAMDIQESDTWFDIM